MTSPRISVIIPVYNGMPYIQKAIDSVLAQDYPAHEIIVIDDGSKDATPELLKKYGSRIITRRIPNSGGPATPKNTGIELATGDHVAFLDHDDVWFKNKLRAQVEDVRKFPEVGFFCSDYITRYPHLGRRLVRHYSVLRQLPLINFDQPLDRHPFLLLLKENFVGTPSAVLIRLDIVKKAGKFRSDHGPCDDYSYWLRCALLTDFVLDSEPLAFKRLHGNNLTLDPGNIFRFHGDVLRSIGLEQGNFIEQHGWKTPYRLALADTDYMLGNLSFEKGNIREAFDYFRKGLFEILSPGNILHYLWVVFKKGVRVVTFDKLGRKKYFTGSRS